MPLFKIIEENNVIIGIWEMIESIENLEDLSNSLIFNNIKYKKIKSVTRKREFLSVRLLLNTILNEDIQIQYSESGKPFLSDCSSNISISHNKNFAVVILSKSIIGIDIEYTKRNTEKIRTRYLAENELKVINQAENSNFLSVHYWAAKEAIYKAIDKSGIVFNKQILIENILNSNQHKYFGVYKEENNETTFRLYYHNIKDSILVYAIEK